MRPPDSPLARFFRLVVRRRVAVALLYVPLVALGIAGALRIPSEGAIDRLLVRGDPEVEATRAFREIFPEGRRAVLILESEDPFEPSFLRSVETLEAALRGVPGVSAYSAAALYRRAVPGFTSWEARADEFRRFVLGTKMAARQGLVGEGFLGIPLEIEATEPEARNAALAAIDGAIARFEAEAPSGTAVRRVGAPWVDAYLEKETARASLRFFPLFALFVVVLTLRLYRSFRALAAFLLTLAACVAIGVGAAAAFGWPFTIVSSLVPLTILVTATATLVYLHSRYVEQPDDLPDEEHQVAALVHKFLPCTASIFAAAVGFAALLVSEIRPIYEMGLWTATGLAITWVVVFTLFPALQRLLRTPTRRERKVAGQRFPHLVDALVPWTWRWRRPLLVAAVGLMLGGAAALFGIPGVLEPMPLETDALDYLPERLALWQDARRFETAVGGLTSVDVWVRTDEGAALDPAFLRGLDRFTRELEADGRVGSASGPTAPLRWARYAGGGGDRLPDDPASWGKAAGDLEQLLLTEPAVRGFVDLGTLASARVAVVCRGEAFGGIAGLSSWIEERWRLAADSEPALAGATVAVVGDGVLASKIATYLVPTLVESFAVTAAVIFLAFLVVFRSGVARILAMIPSVFAILVMFLVMRAVGIPLNVATILIASTVLGASENDQIHFFYHFQERFRGGQDVEAALRHAMLVAGRAVLFATLINAGGFLALALSDLPPMRQFGVVSASAFVLAALADFTALPAALWILYRGRPRAS